MSEGCFYLLANVVILAVKDSRLPEPWRTEVGYTVDPQEAKRWLRSRECQNFMEWLSWPDGYLEILKKRRNLRLIFPSRHKVRARHVVE